ncbi:MAG: cob(I)yrinic acid a,c-diamide adenosyltransferase [Acholeplasmataceae bacterium]
MKIYTKKGDQGQTDLMSVRVRKDDPHIDLIGLLDEVMAHVLMLKHFMLEESIKNDLIKIHDILFMMNYEIAKDSKDGYQTNEEHIKFLESRIDQCDQVLKPLTKFIKLDQNEEALWSNMTRVVTRRAERKFVELSQLQPLNEYSLAFINRLSDYLFTLGRYVTEGRF